MAQPDDPLGSARRMSFKMSASIFAFSIYRLTSRMILIATCMPVQLSLASTQRPKVPSPKSLSNWYLLFMTMPCCQSKCMISSWSVLLPDADPEPVLDLDAESLGRFLALSGRPPEADFAHRRSRPTSWPARAAGDPRGDHLCRKLRLLLRASWRRWLTPPPSPPRSRSRSRSLSRSRSRSLSRPSPRGPPRLSSRAPRRRRSRLSWPRIAATGAAMRARA
mmetsp:Transcript_85633/g.247182  ORF Transcript_85633/g.247182 Transcript_85633/m.247182 type:complete len:221 (+) Transcript_85633:980-1642(+)